MNVTATRMKGTTFFVDEGNIRNQFNVQIINKRGTPARFTIGLAGAPAIRLNLAGTSIEVPALAESTQVAVLTTPQREFHGRTALTLVIAEDRPGGATIERDIEFLGPDLRLQNDDYLSPDHYKN